MVETTTLPLAIPDNIVKFCEERGLLSDLHQAIRIAEEAYAPATNWMIELEADPEVENEEYVVIDVTTTGDVEEILKKNDEFARRFTRSASTEATWRIRVLWNVG